MMHITTKKELCEKCNKRTKCKALCLEAEDYINQDINPDSWIKIKPSASIERRQVTTMPDSVSTTEIILQNYFIDRMTPGEIADNLYKSRQYIYKVINKYSLILKQNIQKTARKG